MSGRPGLRRNAGAWPSSRTQEVGHFNHLSGAKYDMHEDLRNVGDAWYYDDELIYVQKKFVAIPQASTTLDAQGNIVFDRPDDHDGYHLRRDAQGLLGSRRAGQGPDLNYTDGRCPSPPSRFCGQTSTRPRQELALACVKANNDWMSRNGASVSGVNIHSASFPLGRRIGRPRHAATPSAGCELSHSARSQPPQVAQHQHNYWTRCGRCATTTASPSACMSVQQLNRSLHPIQTGPSGDPGLQQAMASLTDWLFSGTCCDSQTEAGLFRGQIGWIRTYSSGRTRSGRCTKPGRTRRSRFRSSRRPNTTGGSSAVSRPTGTDCALLTRSCRQHLLRDGLSAHRHHMAYSEAYIEKLCAGLDDDVAYKVLPATLFACWSWIGVATQGAPGGLIRGPVF